MEEKKQKKNYQKRLILDVTYDQHREVKARAALRNVSMGQYIIEAILKRIHEEKKYE